MRIKAGFVIVVLIVALVAASSARADVVWKGVNWYTRGASTSAVANGTGGLDITVLGHQSGDPGNDNWNLYGSVPAGTKWLEFTFVDTYAGDISLGGPRAYVDTIENNKEYMFQGGIYAERSRYYVNHNVYDYPSATWPLNEWWYTGANSRVAGEHTFKIGMDDSYVDFYFDGIYRGSYMEGLPSQFETIYLGVTTTPGTTFTGTYTDLTYGGTYSHVPLPGTVLLLGPGLVCFAALKRLLKKK